MKNLKELKNSKRIEILSVTASNLLKGGGVVEGIDNLESDVD